MSEEVSYQRTNEDGERVAMTRDEVYSYIRGARRYSDDGIIDYIDEVEELVTVLGSKFSPGRIIHELDPVMFDILREERIEADIDDAECGSLEEFGITVAEDE